MKRLNVGLIGSGFMGRSHALALRQAPAVFPLPLLPHCECLADINDEVAAKAAKDLNFARSTGDWQTLIDDPEIDLIDVTSPNKLHKPMSLAAIAAGKPVYCEKPLAPNAADAFEMARAAEARGVLTFVGFNYLKNPMTRLAKEIVDSGEIGEVWSFRGIHAEDYMSDANAPWTWRLDPSGGAGAIADLGSHIISLGRYIVGEIDRVLADMHTRIDERQTDMGERRKVEQDDEARALIRFVNGAVGSIEASWIATGRKMYLAFELTGSKGSICLNMERQNELRIYISDHAQGRGGYTEIPAGPDHPDYAPFCPAPGHQLGVNDVKTIEVKQIVEAIASGERFYPDFMEAAKIQAVVDSIVKSAKEQRWVRVVEFMPSTTA